MTALLTARGLTKTYRCGHPIVDQANFYLNPGEIVSITGRSGEGKSTIARILCGTLRPDQGTAQLEGESLISEGGRYNTALRPRLQLIQQQPFAALDPRQRILDAVAEPMLHHRLAASRIEARAKARALLQSVWLESGLESRLPTQISGGQAQRVVIARALGVQPRLIIADEATSMLDILSQAQVISIFRALSGRGISILLISHDRPLVKAVAAREYRLEDGKLTEMERETTE